METTAAVEDIKRKLTNWASIGFGSDKNEPQMFLDLLQALEARVREEEREKCRQRLKEGTFY